jgi:hypothetical protein
MSHAVLFRYCGLLLQNRCPIVISRSISSITRSHVASPLAQYSMTKFQGLRSLPATDSTLDTAIQELGSYQKPSDCDHLK